MLPCEFGGILEDRRKQFQQRNRGRYASDSAGRRMTRQPEITNFEEQERDFESTIIQNDLILIISFLWNQNFRLRP